MSAVYKQLATEVGAYQNCIKLKNQVWLDRHVERADNIMSDLMPRGSGMDSGTKLNWKRSSTDKLVFDTAFHHMNENGMYDGWTEHTIIVRPSLQFGFYLTVSGRDRNDIKDYLNDVFETALRQEIEFDDKRNAFKFREPAKMPAQYGNSEGADNA